MVYHVEVDIPPTFSVLYDVRKHLLQDIAFALAFTSSLTQAPPTYPVGGASNNPSQFPKPLHKALHILCKPSHFR